MGSFFKIMGHIARDVGREVADEVWGSRRDLAEEERREVAGQAAHRIYGHLEDTLHSDYGKRGETVDVEPKGRGMPDMLGNDKDGNRFIGEIKNRREVDGSTSSWWSFWKQKLIPVYRQRTETLDGASRGWLAVIDGQMRRYADEHSACRGDLVVEKGERDEASVKRALDFLKEEGRIRSYRVDVASDDHLRVTVDYRE